MRGFRKKRKNFKTVIAEEKTKGKNSRKIKKIITGINSSALYCFFFLLVFVGLDTFIYVVFSPEVFIWALSLCCTAALSSVVASRLTNKLKKQQWKYVSE